MTYKNTICCVKNVKKGVRKMHFSTSSFTGDYLLHSKRWRFSLQEAAYCSAKCRLLECGRSCPENAPPPSAVRAGDILYYKSSQRKPEDARDV